MILRHCFAYLLFAGIPAVAAPASGDATVVLGRIGDIDIRIDEVRDSLAGLGRQEEATVSENPALLNQIVRSLLVQRVLYSEAVEKGWDKKPEVTARAERARIAAITDAYLQSVTAPPDDFPSDAEVTAAYEAARPALLVPKSWRLAQIFLAEPKDADKETSAKARTTLETVKKALKASPADFGKLAAEHSEERTSAANNGEIGWLAEDRIQPEIRAKLDGLDLQQMTEPIRLEDGWHIVRVLDVREPFTPPLEQVRDQIVEQMRAEKIRENSQAYLANLLQENPLAINELELSKVLTRK